MNIDNIVDSLEGSFEDKMRIIDDVLHSGVITVGNYNDYTNLFNRIIPSSEGSTRTEIINNLEDLCEKGDRLKYVFSDKLFEEFVYKVEFGNLNLTFIKE
jgi:hypothetical protein